MRDKIVRLDISLPRKLVESFDLWWQKNGFTSRSEAVRTLIRTVLKQGFNVAAEDVEGRVD